MSDIVEVLPEPLNTIVQKAYQQNGLDGFRVAWQVYEHKHGLSESVRELLLAMEKAM